MDVLAYLKLNWSIFPVRARSKAPLTPNGWKNASNDIDTVSDWLEECAGCNWAVATGPSKLIVVDVDTYKGTSIDELGAVLGEALPQTWQARTGRGGMHLFFAAPEDQPATKLSLIKGVDVLSATGYVLIAPSVNEQGQSYEWVVAPGVCPLAPAPESLLRLTRAEPTPAPQSPAGDVKELYLRAGDGRWTTLQRYAGSLRAMSLGEKTILITLEAIAKYHCEPDPSISPGKLRSLARWACEQPPTNLKNPTRIKKASPLASAPPLIFSPKDSK